jgi:hypothetical protein
MNEIKLFEQVKDEPMALFVLGGVVLIKIIEHLIKYSPRLFSFLFLKDKKLPFWKWQNFVSERINEIESQIKLISNTLLAHEFLLDKTSEGTLENQLFMEDEKRTFLRLKAFRRLLAMKKNGRVWEKGFSLIIKHKETWLDVLDTELGIKIVDEKYYNDRLEEIRKRIFDDFSGKQ